MSQEIYIDREDFSDEHKGGFYGLTPEQPVCLKYGFVISLVEIVKTPEGLIDHVKVKALPNFDQKLKGYIHWVAKDHAVDAIVRVYNYLFTVPEPGDDWFDFVNPESFIEKRNAKVWKNIEGSVEYDRY